jgi:hypothetical protein
MTFPAREFQFARPLSHRPVRLSQEYGARAGKIATMRVVNAKKLVFPVTVVVTHHRNVLIVNNTYTFLYLRNKS